MDQTLPEGYGLENRHGEGERRFPVPTYVSISNALVDSYPSECATRNPASGNTIDRNPSYQFLIDVEPAGPRLVYPGNTNFTGVTGKSSQSRSPRTRLLILSVNASLSLDKLNTTVYTRWKCTLKVRSTGLPSYDESPEISASSRPPSNSPRQEAPPRPSRRPRPIRRPGSDYPCPVTSREPPPPESDNPPAGNSIALGRVAPIPPRDTNRYPPAD